jgi:DNA topoisomerase-1
MPKKKKKAENKSKGEKIAENYFPVDEGNLKYAIEKPVKEQLSVETVEKIGKIKEGLTKRKYSRKKKSSKTKARSKAESNKTRPKRGWAEKPYTPPKISLKPNGYELIITEKPQAALKIASALGESTKRNQAGVPYYEVNRKGKKLVVASAVGHLFTLKQNSNKSKPIFDISWTPNFLVRKRDFTKKYYDTLLKLTKGASSLTVATDFDIEGEVIGLNVVRFIGGQKDASRMKFSTLTTNELNQAYEEKKPSIEWGQAIAGETRHYLDWFYGINLSRALMSAIKTTGRFKLMSIGRVQGPALNLIVKKEREIMAFKPETYWQVFITVKQEELSLELKHNKDIFKKSELSKFEKLKGKITQVETRKTQQKIPPQPPFNLTTLQTEAYKFHGITPSRALQLAQSLYLNGIISYPRTSSQKLPKEIGYKEILDKLAKKFNVEKLITRKTPIEGKKSDPAHPSIYPTGQSGTMNSDEEKIYNLIVKRFLALFCDDAIIDNKTIRTEINKLVFSTRGSEVKQKGWMEIYPTKMKEVEVPDMEGEAEITDVRNEQKETQPPKRYSPASILTELEKRNLGTKATRASILETLYKRDYVREKSIEATQFGISLITSLERYSPTIIDEKLTRDFEKQMESIVGLKTGQKEKEDKIIAEAKKTITKIIKQFEKNEKKIGQELLQANDKIIEQQRIENTLTQCPKCKKGNLRIIYNKNYKSYFVGCSNYPECKTTYPLPQGFIKNPNKTCEHCGFPKLLRLKKGKRPWEFCFNPECPKRKEREKENGK